MDNIIKKTLVEDKNLGNSLRLIHGFIIQNNFPEFEGRYSEIESNYALMKDFMQKGYKDAERDKLYISLLQKSFCLYSDMLTTLKKRNNSALNHYSSLSVVDKPLDAVKEKLEAFVQDTALLSLEEFDEGKQTEIYREHHEFMTSLFYHIMMDKQWGRKTKEFYQDLLLSPTVDSVDVQLIVSSVMLSLLQAFDANKFLMLVYVYRYSLDVKVKQRALVGWVLAIPENEYGLFPEIKEEIDGLLQSESVRQELLELQIQMIYCTDAEKDTAEIQKEIMPNLIKGQNLSIITEIGEDSLQDILNPASSEQAMENLEKSYHKMQEMQKKGSDIYFGGFSQMKRFPFFNIINNWFCPFYPEHPELKTISGIDCKNFIRNLFNNGPFCNSDKYSFALAMSTVINQIPPSIREMMGSENVFINQDVSEEQDKAAYIRRMYLQDIYRFFKVSYLRTHFIDPFDMQGEHRNAFFFTNGMFKDVGLELQVKELGRFLLRKKKHDLLKRLFMQFPALDDMDSLYLQAVNALHYKEYFKAQALYEKVLEFSPNDERALKGMAQASFYIDDFERAEKYYNLLNIMNPNDRNVALNLCVSKIRNQHVEEGVELLFKLQYENPHDLNILRALAWGEMMLRRLSDAETVYGKILEKGANVRGNDYLNAGYCKWFLGKIGEAVAFFRQFVEESNVSVSDAYSLLSDSLINDIELIRHNGLSDIDVNVMIDLTLG